jgi:hypothetical protein
MGLIIITSLDDLEREALEVDSFLKVTCSEDPNEALQRGNDLSVYLARTNKMLADSKHWCDEAININTILVHQTYKTMSPTIQKKLIESMCKRENYLVTFVDRLNRTAVHQLDFVRTIISLAKEEMKFAGFSNSNR